MVSDQELSWAAKLGESFFHPPYTHTAPSSTSPPGTFQGKTAPHSLPPVHVSGACEVNRVPTPMPVTHMVDPFASSPFTDSFVTQNDVLSWAAFDTPSETTSHVAHQAHDISQGDIAVASTSTPSPNSEHAENMQVTEGASGSPSKQGRVGSTHARSFSLHTLTKGDGSPCSLQTIKESPLEADDTSVDSRAQPCLGVEESSLENMATQATPQEPLPSPLIVCPRLPSPGPRLPTTRMRRNNQQAVKMQKTEGEFPLKSGKSVGDAKLGSGDPDFQMESGVKTYQRQQEEEDGGMSSSSSSVPYGRRQLTPLSVSLSNKRTTFEHVPCAGTSEINANLSSRRVSMPETSRVRGGESTSARRVPASFGAGKEGKGEKRDFAQTHAQTPSTADASSSNVNLSTSRNWPPNNPSSSSICTQAYNEHESELTTTNKTKFNNRTVHFNPSVGVLKQRRTEMQNARVNANVVETPPTTRESLSVFRDATVCCEPPEAQSDTVTAEISQDGVLTQAVSPADIVAKAVLETDLILQAHSAKCNHHPHPNNHRDASTVAPSPPSSNTPAPLPPSVLDAAAIRELLVPSASSSNDIPTVLDAQSETTVSLREAGVARDCDEFLPSDHAQRVFIALEAGESCMRHALEQLQRMTRSQPNATAPCSANRIELPMPPVASMSNRRSVGEFGNEEAIHLMRICHEISGICFQLQGLLLGPSGSGGAGDWHIPSHSLLLGNDGLEPIRGGEIFSQRRLSELETTLRALERRVNVLDKDGTGQEAQNDTSDDKCLRKESVSTIGHIDQRATHTSPDPEPNSHTLPPLTPTVSPTATTTPTTTSAPAGLKKPQPSIRNELVALTHHHVRLMLAIAQWPISFGLAFVPEWLKTTAAERVLPPVVADLLRSMNEQE